MKLSFDQEGIVLPAGGGGTGFLSFLHAVKHSIEAINMNMIFFMMDR
jgi:hypothetical protein